jgi:hypothetical protein
MLEAIAHEGVRPVFPEATPHWYAALAARCWAAEPRQRPSFRRVAAHLASLPLERLAWGAAGEAVETGERHEARAAVGGLAGRPRPLVVDDA